MRINKTSKKTEIEIIELSKTKSQKEIALIYNKTQPMISNILKCHENTLNYHVKRNSKFKNYIWKHEE